MATLPVSEIDLSNGVEFRRQPSLTWAIDKNLNRITGEVDGMDAVRQAVEIILNVERFRWQIFLPSSGVEWMSIIGIDSGYAAAELRRQVEEAVTMDDRVTGIEDFSYAVDGDSMTVYLTTGTVYGSFSTQVEVSTT